MGAEEMGLARGTGNESSDDTRSPLLLALRRLLLGLEVEVGLVEGGGSGAPNKRHPASS